MTPITTMMKVETTAVSAIFWKRDMHPGVYRGDDGPDGRGQGLRGRGSGCGGIVAAMRTSIGSRISRLGLLAGGALLATTLVTPTVSVAQSPSGAPDCGPVSTTGNYAGWPVGGNISANGPLLPLVVSSQNVAGPPTRFAFALVDPQNKPLSSAAVATQVRFFALDHDPANPVATGTGTFLDVGNGTGFYHLPVTFPCAGNWGFEVTAGLAAGAASARVIFTVLPYGTTPAIGASAPASVTPTATTPEGIAAISTDTTPDPAFYTMSIAQAVAAGKPAFIIFATPAFCRSAMCGPTLDIVKSVAADYKGRVNFVHVEPYQLQQTATGLQPLLTKAGELQPVQSVLDYGLPTEPYMFLTDATGHIAAKVEGIAGADEIRAALDAVLAPKG